MSRSPGRSRESTFVAAGLWMLGWLAIVALCLHKIFAYDVWWQIAAGRWILDHGIPEIDPFSYAFPGREWIEPRWLWCLLLHGLARSLGLNSLILLQTLLGLLAFFLLVRTAPDAPSWIRVLGLAVALGASYERLTTRPELISFVGSTWFLLALERYRASGSKGWLFSLPAVQVVWTNTHALWVLGPILLWITCLAEWLEGLAARSWPALFPRVDRLSGRRLRLLVVVALLTTGAALVHPYGSRGVLFPLHLFSEIRTGHLFDEAIQEFRGPLSSAFFGWNARTIVWLGAIALSTAALLLDRRGLSLPRLGLWAAFLFLSFEAQRNVALFGFVAGWVVMSAAAVWVARLGPNARRTARRAIAGATALALGITIPLVATDRFYRATRSDRQFGFGVSERRFPMRALAFLRQNAVRGHVLHALGDGGYVLHEGGEGSVYVDGRLEVYGSEIIQRVWGLILNGDGLAAEARRAAIEAVLVPNDDGYRKLLSTLERSPEWVPVYYDALHVAYLRRTHPEAARLALDWQRPAIPPVELPEELTPRDWLAGWWPRAADDFADARIGALLLAVGGYERAFEHLERAHRTNPSNSLTRLHLSMFYRAQGREAEAARLERGVPAAWSGSLEAELLRAQVYSWAGRPGEASACFDRARALGAPEPELTLRQAQAEIRAGLDGPAEERLTRAAREGPELAEAWNLLAVIALRRGDALAARERFERSLAIDPAQPAVYRTLARLYREAGDERRADELERRLLERPGSGGAPEDAATPLLES